MNTFVLFFMPNKSIKLKGYIFTYIFKTRKIDITKKT